MTLTTTAPGNDTSDAAALVRFGEQVRRMNPFQIHRVVQPSQTETHAPAVHQAQFRQLTELAEIARNQDYGIGAVLWGEAGTGKSHLLGRLAHWANDEKHGCLVYLQNLQANPESLPRTLLRATLSILTEGRQDRWHESRLFKFMNAALKAAFHQAGVERPSLGEAEQAYQRWLDRLGAENPERAPLLDRTTIYNTLFRFFASAYSAREGTEQGDLARLAVQWLSGDSLDPDQARALGLPRVSEREAEEGVALGDEEQIKRVLVALCQLARLRKQPFILCFDGVDALETRQVSELARFLHALLDSASNLLVITSGVEETLLDWLRGRVIQQSSWDRLADRKVIPLSRIKPVEARQIVEVRLEQFFEPFVTLEPVKKRLLEDRLFPLGQRWFEESLAEKEEVRARDVIKWARDGWERQQHALAEMGAARWLEQWPGKTGEGGGTTQSTLEELIDAKVDEKLAEHHADRLGHPERLPPDADNMAGLIANLLKQCLAKDDNDSLAGIEHPVPARRGQKPAFQMVLRHKAGTTGILVLTASNAISTAALLRRAVQEPQPPTRFVLVTDERRPLRLGAAGNGHRDKLRQRHGSDYVEQLVSFEQYAQLDALQVVIGMARSGDLEVEHPRGTAYRVKEREVIASHHRQDRYRKQPLLGLLLGSSAKPAPKSENTPPQGKKPLENDYRQVIHARLALMPGASSRELAQYAVGFFKSQNFTLELTPCKERLEAVARAMANEGLVNVTPLDDGLFVMARKR